MDKTIEEILLEQLEQPVIVRSLGGESLPG